ncbi:MAG: response regulator transcription factor [Cyclobacteriaceae bacterium]
MAHSIVIADDYYLYAEGVKKIIDDEFNDYKVLYTVENGNELQQQFSDPSRIPDIVLLDVKMPVMNGFETAAWIRDQHPQVRILVLSVNDEEKTIIEMVRCGARGYLLKSTKKAELKQALDFLVEKGYYYSEWITHNVFKSLGGNEKVTKVSDLELKFLHLAASPLTFRQIGEKMFKSPRTAEDYRENLCSRFGLKTRLELVLFALKEGIINLEDIQLKPGRKTS